MRHLLNFVPHAWTPIMDNTGKPESRDMSLSVVAGELRLNI